MPELLAVLIFFMIIGALVAIETENLLYSIISVGAVGFLLAMAFLVLGAPDIAITQVVVEVIMLVILIRATISRDLTTVSGHREFVAMMATVTMVLTLTVLGIIMLAEFPALGSSVMDRVAQAPSNTYLREGLASTGAANMVTSVLLDFRAYDTLGEATILFCSILGALTILRRKARKQRTQQDEESDAV